LQIAADSVAATILPGIAPAKRSGNARCDQQQQERDRSFVKKGARKKRGEAGVTPFAIEECWTIHRALIGESETIKVSLGQEVMLMGKENHVFESGVIVQACLPAYVPNLSCRFTLPEGRKTKSI
jgi:hypothetical protein